MKLRFNSKHVSMNRYMKKLLNGSKLINQISERRSFSTAQKIYSKGIIIVSEEKNQNIPKIENLIEGLMSNLEKLNLKEIEKNIDICLESNIKLDKKCIYSILNSCYDKSLSITKKLEVLLSRNGSELNSGVYSYIILSYLKFLGFKESFVVFSNCCSLGIQPMTNVIIELYKKLIDENNNLEGKNDYKNFLEIQIKTYYKNDQFNTIFYKLNEEYKNSENNNKNNNLFKNDNNNKTKKKKNKETDPISNSPNIIEFIHLSKDKILDLKNSKAVLIETFNNDTNQNDPDQQK